MHFTGEKIIRSVLFSCSYGIMLDLCCGLKFPSFSCLLFFPWMLIFIILRTYATLTYNYIYIGTQLKNKNPGGTIFTVLPILLLGIKCTCSKMMELGRVQSMNWEFRQLLLLNQGLSRVLYMQKSYTCNTINTTQNYK